MGTAGLMCRWCVKSQSDVVSKLWTLPTCHGVALHSTSNSDGHIHWLSALDELPRRSYLEPVLPARSSGLGCVIVEGAAMGETLSDPESMVHLGNAGLDVVLPLAGQLII